MRKAFSIFVVLFLVFAVDSFAQAADRIAFINSDELLEELSEKKKATKEVNDLNQKYKDELILMQNDYNKKYSDFISYQTSMAENIRLRRMQELYELEQHLNNFMQVAQEDVLKKEQELLQPLRARIKNAIYEVGVEGDFLCVYDLSNPTILFVTPDGVDITALVKSRLGIR